MQQKQSYQPNNLQVHEINNIVQEDQNEWEFYSLEKPGSSHNSDAWEENTE